MKKLPYLRLALTARCTNSCIFCSKDFNPAKNDMDTDFARRLITAFAQAGGSLVSFTGGEPLIYPGLKELLSCARNGHLLTRVTTNGSEISVTDPDLLAMIDFFHISIISLKPANYRHYCRPVRSCSRSDLESRLDKVLALGKKARINSLYLGDNGADIAEIAQFCLERNVEINVMNDMFASSFYQKRYLEFCIDLSKKFPNVTYRTSRNPEWNICRMCDRRRNCASTRAIWAFPDRSFGLCPQFIQRRCRAEGSIPIESVISIAMQHDNIDRTG